MPWPDELLHETLTALQSIFINASFSCRGHSKSPGSSDSFEDLGPEAESLRSKGIDGSALVSYSKGNVIHVAIQYRLGAYGFMGAKEVLTDGAPNLGLLDQRLAMEWGTVTRTSTET